MQLKTKKQKLYFKEVILLHQERGLGEDRISRVLPIGHATVSRWIRTFASENEKPIDSMSKSRQQHRPAPAAPQEKDVKALESEIARLQGEVKHAQLRADAYDEMINVAEAKFNIAIRKKAGAKR